MLGWGPGAEVGVSGFLGPTTGECELDQQDLQHRESGFDQAEKEQSSESSDSGSCRPEQETGDSDILSSCDMNDEHA